MIFTGRPPTPPLVAEFARIQTLATRSVQNFHSLLCCRYYNACNKNIMRQLQVGGFSEGRIVYSQLHWSTPLPPYISQTPPKMIRQPSNFRKKQVPKNRYLIQIWMLDFQNYDVAKQFLIIWGDQVLRIRRMSKVWFVLLVGERSF